MLFLYMERYLTILLIPATTSVAPDIKKLLPFDETRYNWPKIYDYGFTPQIRAVARKSNKLKFTAARKATYWQAGYVSPYTLKPLPQKIFFKIINVSPGQIMPNPIT